MVALPTGGPFLFLSLLGAVATSSAISGNTATRRHLGPLECPGRVSLHSGGAIAAAGLDQGEELAYLDYGDRGDD
jgi:hypothetical protein